MINKEEIFELSKAGADALKAELEKLKTVDRIQIREAIKEAREQGDLSENADYSSAREQQASIEARILEIENILKHAKIMDVNTVTIKYVDLNKIATFQIVGTIEADPFAGKISNDSPLGKAVIGHNVGDVFHISTENGKELKVELIDLK
ncbi:MAG: transcription elongation factor GreA [Anaeroplasmataceae bacterium]|jgi:Transcription elongation factor|nr:transcription elongation factor GreA [Anaeroplasmataceae bacterium]